MAVAVCDDHRYAEFRIVVECSGSAYTLERGRKRIMSYEQQVRLWSKAVKKSAKKVLSSKRKTSRFMKSTGIVAKSGNRLAKAYR
jgi:hypothetical protein